MISIGIPFYNAEAYLEDAIKSVLAQTFQEWELILVDDGSSDGSLDIAKRIEQKDQRVRVFSDGLNKRLPARLNQIINEAKFDYIARMDADDIMHPHRLEKQLEVFLTSDNIDIISSSYFTLNSKNEVVDMREINKNSFEIADFIAGNHFICHPTVMARKEWFLRNPYDPNFDRAEDFELWVRAISKNDFKIKILSDKLFFYREDGSINKDKLISSYLMSDLIFSTYKNKFGFFNYFGAVGRNSLKIFLISIFYSKWFEKKLINKRSYKKINEIEKINANNIIRNIENYEYD